MVAVTQRLADDPEIREEDFAATFMAIQNLCLAAAARGLGTHIKTGAVLGDAPLREALGVGEGERIVAVVQLGEPEEVPAPKAREPAEAKTRWLP
jgi:nitroreductase